MNKYRGLKDSEIIYIMVIAFLTGMMLMFMNDLYECSAKVQQHVIVDHKPFSIAEPDCNRDELTHKEWADCMGVGYREVE